MTWVKLCGMRTPGDVLAAGDAGADAIGLVTAERSIRRLTVARARSLAETSSLPAYLVTEDLSVAAALQQARSAGVAGLQPHGPDAVETAVAAREAGFEVLLPVGVDFDLEQLPAGVVPIVDGPLPGSGTARDWSGVGFERPFVLAGGLTPDTVADAITASGAYGVDVSSGIESEPGVKDHELMRLFVEAAR